MATIPEVAAQANSARTVSAEGQGMASGLISTLNDEVPVQSVIEKLQESAGILDGIMAEAESASLTQAKGKLSGAVTNLEEVQTSLANALMALENAQRSIAGSHQDIDNFINGLYNL